MLSRSVGTKWNMPGRLGVDEFELARGNVGKPGSRLHQASTDGEYTDDGYTSLFKAEAALTALVSKLTA